MTSWNSRNENARTRPRRRAMLRRWTVLGILLAGVLVVLVGTESEGAGQSMRGVPRVITLARDRDEPLPVTSGFATRHRGPVRFDHAGHISRYRMPCTTCHHEHRAHQMEFTPTCNRCHRGADDAVTRPVNLRCSECHSTRGLLRFSGEEAIERRDSGMATKLHFSADAFHGTCITCHQQSNIADRDDWAPVSCIACHQQISTNYEFTED